MKKDKKVINFADCKIESACKSIEDERKIIDADLPESEEDLELAIAISIEQGDTNLHSLTRVVLNIAEAVDKLEDTLAKIAKIIGITLDEGRVLRKNGGLFND